MHALVLSLHTAGDNRHHQPPKCTSIGKHEVACRFKTQCRTSRKPKVTKQMLKNLKQGGHPQRRSRQRSLSSLQYPISRNGPQESPLRAACGSSRGPAPCGGGNACGAAPQPPCLARPPPSPGTRSAAATFLCRRKQPTDVMRLTKLWPDYPLDRPPCMARAATASHSVHSRIPGDSPLDWRLYVGLFQPDATRHTLQQGCCHVLHHRTVFLTQEVAVACCSVQLVGTN